MAVRSDFLLVCYILGDRSGSARFWSMKTSQTMCMILLYYDLVIKSLSIDLLSDKFSEERLDLSVFSPACLPNISASLVGQEGHVYGGQLHR